MAQIKKEENIRRLSDLPVDPKIGTYNSGIIFCPYITDIITGMPHTVKPSNIPPLKIKSSYSIVKNMTCNNNGKN